MTNVVLSDYTLDNGLQVFPTLCDRIYVCSGAITDFNSALSSALGFKNFGAGNAFSAISNALPSGRQVSSIAFSDGSMTAGGTAVNWVAVDFSDSKLLAWGPLAAPVIVSQGQLFALSSFTINEAGWFANIIISCSPALSLTTQSPGFALPAFTQDQNFAISAFMTQSPDFGVPGMGVISNFSTSGIASSSANLGQPRTSPYNLSANNLTAGAAGIGQPSFTGPNWWGDDGSANAPAGTAQYPGLFTDPVGTNGGIPAGNAGAPYAQRQPWKVAGVDYAVGPDTNKYPTLQNPTAAPLTSGLNTTLYNLGARLSGTAPNQTVTFSTANQTIDGWDFSGLGCALSINASGITISNCKVITNSSSLGWCIVSTYPCTIINCWLDQQKVGVTGKGVIDFYTAVPGTHVVHYCWIRNAWAETFQFGNDVTSGSLSLDIAYNVCENAGWGFSSGAHGDMTQFSPISSTTQWGSINYKFNTFLQWAPLATARTQGFTFAPNVGYIQSSAFDYNTFIVTIQGFTNGILNTWNENTSVSAEVNYNYLDLSGMNPNTGAGAPYGSWLYDYNAGGPYHITTTVTGNVNLVTGAAMTLGEAPVFGITFKPVVVPAGPFTEQVSNGGVIAKILANENPTSWTITAGNGAGNFAISNSGVLTFTANAVTNLTGSGSLSISVAATNSTGQGSAVSFTINYHQ